MLSQALVHQNPVGMNEVREWQVVLKNSGDKSDCFFPQVIGKLWRKFRKERLIRIAIRLPLETKPLESEGFSQCPRAVVGQHPADLHFQGRFFKDFLRVREGEQLFVGNGRPQEQSKSGGQLMSSQALHSGTLRFGFHDKQKMWRDENSLEWLRDGRQKIGRH